MLSVPRLLHHLMQLVCTLLALLGNTARFLRLCLRSPVALAAENLFLRKQLALYQERHIKPQRATDATRLTLVWLARCFDWRHALVIVPTRHVDPLASPGVSAVLAVEVHTWTPADPSRSPSPYPSHGL